MRFLDLVQMRRSIRAFAPRAVDAEQRREILEAARRAPSAGNLQAYEIVEVHGPARKARLAAAARGQEFVGRAPLILVFSAVPALSAEKYGARGEQLYCEQDATIACAYAQLAAAAVGLGSVWVGAFDEDAVRAAIDADPLVRPVAILPIGYPAEPGEATDRRPLAQLVRQVS